MKNYRTFLGIMTWCFSCMLFTACPGSTNEDPEEPTIEKTPYDLEIESELEGTTWKCTREESINYDLVTPGRGMISFGYGGVAYFFDLERETPDWDGEWYVKNNKLWMIPSSGNNDYARKYLALFGLAQEIIKLTDKELIGSTQSTMFYFSRQKYTEKYNGGGGGSSSGYKPEVTDFDFTATKTSIKVTFKIDSKPTSASIYYGESSATKSAGDVSIIGNSVTARASGLKSGTKYYFKITVKNNYGSTTSDGWPATTLY